MENKNLTWAIIALVLLQTLLIVIFNLSYRVRHTFPIFSPDQNQVIYIVFSLLLLLTSAGMIYILFTTANRDMQLLRQELYIENLKESLKNLRAQRHDFVSHLQTVYGLLQLEMADAALEYITSLCNEVSQPTRIIEVNQPVLAALFRTKAATAEARGINFQYEINSDLKGFLLPQADLTSIFGNLLDNAIEAAMAALPGMERRIWLRIFNADNYYCFEVGNTGPAIPLELQKKIFERGFTTKKDDKENHGQGLYIAQKLVAAHNGQIKVYSSEHGTVFTVRFPVLK
ncbi:sensor histidine kinase [Moorella sulfitireducens]|uniref:sensor histidine kinase n=1 Tax=Neomoorella sulfitireducens TaxID=2972948 RepID=UPI0021ACF62F|nr:ATP-binding protein [Moorella sulfitireducens]